MHKISKYVTPIALSVAFLTSSAWAEATTGSAKPSTQLIADGCAVCHGTDGSSPGHIDKLRNMKQKKFLEKMKKYKYEKGKGRIMGPINRGLSDEQIQALADHFQALSR